MTHDQSIPVFDWFSNQHTIKERAAFVEQIHPVLTSLFQPGERVLDLCCGAGAIAFFLENEGASVTGIDLAPSLIAAAREEGTKRRSQTTFIQGNVLTDPIGNEEYDLIICLGNAILDFPHQDFSQFRDKVCRALKPGGHFVVEYHDGVLRVMRMSQPIVSLLKERVDQDQVLEARHSPAGRRDEPRHVACLWQSGLTRSLGLSQDQGTLEP